MAALRAPGYVRYMDDFIVFAEQRDLLQAIHGEIAAWLALHLGLSLKKRATVLAPAREGLPFLGWRLYRGMRRLRPANLRLTRRRLERRLRAHAREDG